jgi:SPX domain protein involved in polyphosphate accumulation
MKGGKCMVINSFKRYEKKFILTKEQYTNLIEKLDEYMEVDKHCRNNKNYNIYNIYYDTNNNDVIRHSISNPYYKEKLRLRSYKIPKDLNDKVFLELKKKINGIVNKRRISLTLDQAYRFLNLGEKPIFDDYVNNQVANEIEYYLSQNDVNPTIYIGYTRKAFFGKEDKNFRLTFDTKILTRRNELSLELGCFGNDILNEDEYLMEVKILGAIPLWFTNILSENLLTKEQ